MPPRGRPSVPGLKPEPSSVALSPKHCTSASHRTSCADHRTVAEGCHSHFGPQRSIHRLAKTPSSRSIASSVTSSSGPPGATRDNSGCCRGWLDLSELQLTVSLDSYQKSNSCFSLCLGIAYSLCFRLQRESLGIPALFTPNMAGHRQAPRRNCADQGYIVDRHPLPSLLRGDPPPPSS